MMITDTLQVNGDKMLIFLHPDGEIYVVKASSPEDALVVLESDMSESYSVDRIEDKFIDGEWHEVVFDNRGICRIT